MRLSILFLFLLPSFAISAQDIEKVKPNKGKIYILWGWNNGWYSNSDINFTGDNYDFTLDNVEATDRPTPFSYNDYFKPSRITIPQTNFRIGYFINENIDISFGVDHMKYVMVANQQSSITGKIENESLFSGEYDNDDIIISEEFLKFEHTDGLNYLNLEVTYNEDFLKLFKLNSNRNKIALNYLAGIGIGALMPRSNVTLMNNERHDEFHFAGYGVAAKIGLDLTFFRFFFIRSEYKAGFINMPDIRTTPNSNDRASQHFWFTQLNYDFGVSFNLFNKKTRSPIK